jgi:hypothetical protein
VNALHMIILCRSARIEIDDPKIQHIARPSPSHGGRGGNRLIAKAPLEQALDRDERLLQLLVKSCDT